MCREQHRDVGISRKELPEMRSFVLICFQVSLLKIGRISLTSQPIGFFNPNHGWNSCKVGDCGSECYRRFRISDGEIQAIGRGAGFRRGKLQIEEPFGQDLVACRISEGED